MSTFSHLIPPTISTTAKFLTDLFTPSEKKPTLSKNEQRRRAHTHLIYAGPMRHRDGKERPVTWYRFDIGRFMDRSKYNGDGSRK